MELAARLVPRAKTLDRCMKMVGRRCPQRAGVRHEKFYALLRFQLGAVRTPLPTLGSVHKLRIIDRPQPVLAEQFRELGQPALLV